MISAVIILLRYPLSQPDGCQLSQRESQGALPYLPAIYLLTAVACYGTLIPKNVKE